MHDIVEFEKRGIPATVFITQIFRNSAATQFRNKGMDGHLYLDLPHPVSNLTPEQMRELTLRYIPDMVRQLTA